VTLAWLTGSFGCMFSRENVETHPIRRSLKFGLGVSALLISLSLAIPAGADDEISVAPDTPVFGDPGTVHTIASQPVAAELVGEPCDLKVTSTNGGSVHMGNVLTVRTGEHVIVVENVEDSSDASLHRLERVTMGETLTVELTLGEDGVSSLGYNVGFECTPEDLVPEVKPGRVENPDTTPATTPATDPPSPLPVVEPARATPAEPTFTG